MSSRAFFMPHASVNVTDQRIKELIRESEKSQHTGRDAKGEDMGKFCDPSRVELVCGRRPGLVASAFTPGYPLTTLQVALHNCCAGIAQKHCQSRPMSRFQ